MSTTSTHQITRDQDLTIPDALLHTATCVCGWHDVNRNRSALTRAVNKHLATGRFDGHKLTLSRRQIGMTPIAPSRPMFGTIARCACGWRTQVNKSPSKGGTKQATALWRAHAEAAVLTPFQRGKDACRAGQPRTVPTDLFDPNATTPPGSQDLTGAREWGRGWDTALTEPIEETKR